MFASVLKDARSKREHGVDVCTTKVKESIVQSCVKSDGDRIGNAQRQWNIGTCEDVDIGSHNLVRRRWWCLPFLDLWWSLLSNGACKLKGRFPRHSLNKVEMFLSDGIALEEDLELSSAVAQIDKANCTFTTIGFHESTNSDLCSDKVCALVLDFA